MQGRASEGSAWLTRSPGRWQGVLRPSSRSPSAASWPCSFISSLCTERLQAASGCSQSRAGFPESGVTVGCLVASFFLLPLHNILSSLLGAQQPGQRAKQPPSCPLLFSSVLLFVMDGLFSWMPSHARGRHWTSIEEMRSGDQLCFLSCEERELALVPHKPAICSDLHCLATNATSRWSPGRHQPGACSLC